MYMGWSKIFRTGGAICIAVVLAPSTGRWYGNHVNESACQVLRKWDDVGSFYTRLFGVVYVTRDDFHNGSEKGTASVHQILCQSWEKCYEMIQ